MSGCRQGANEEMRFKSKTGLLDESACAKTKSKTLEPLGGLAREDDKDERQAKSLGGLAVENKDRMRGKNVLLH